MRPPAVLIQSTSRSGVNMFINDQLVYIELQKTGCTHIGDLLSRLLDGELRRYPTPHLIPSRKILTSERIVMTSIRSPWDWYLSQWKFGVTWGNTGGCTFAAKRPKYSLKNRGYRLYPFSALYSLLREHRRNPAAWKQVLPFGDVDNVEAFRSWFYMMHDPCLAGDLGEGYGIYPLKKFAGFYTYVYLRSSCFINWRLLSVGSLSSLRRYVEVNSFIDEFIHTESIVVDLLSVLSRFSLIDAEDLSTLATKLNRLSATNVSKAPSKSCREFYSPEMDLIILERERLLIDKFGYRPPS